MTKPPSKSSFISSATVTIPANAQLPFNSTGAFFICKESTGTFAMSFNDGGFFVMEVGLGFRLAAGEEFTKLTFKNDTATAMDVTFYTGLGDVRDARLNTIISRLALLSFNTAPTYTKGYGTIGNYLTATGSPDVYTGADGVKVRKQISFQNVDSTNALWILSGDNKVMVAIPAGQMWTMESSGIFKALSNSGGTQYLCGEIFYS